MFAGCKAQNGRQKDDGCGSATTIFRQVLIQRPDVPELILVDVSDLSPEQAAHAVLARLNSLTPMLQPATLQHLRMKR